MTKTLTLRALDIPSVHKFGIGFDRMFDELQRLTDQQSSYPPYNILKINDNQFVIELAIAGFSEGEIEVAVEKNILVIKGSKVKSIDEAPKEYVVKNIANRDFDRTFTLAEYVEVVDAVVSNGILSVYLEIKVPDEKLPKRIAISYNK
jgi:molecular chaperone IbpA